MPFYQMKTKEDNMTSMDMLPLIIMVLVLIIQTLIFQISLVIYLAVALVTLVLATLGAVEPQEKPKVKMS